ncbi:hypothetical protein Scep_018171 [Stephania cephalantha]|uniref:Uncharacterized protein n=1 Tax=Stephania cephalantha TaxID=152367 RepID=A0AAP0ISA0_9MAGN
MEEMSCFSYFYYGEDEEFNHGKTRYGRAKEARPTVNPNVSRLSSSLLFV